MWPTVPKVIKRALTPASSTRSSAAPTPRKGSKAFGGSWWSDVQAKERGRKVAEEQIDDGFASFFEYVPHEPKVEDAKAGGAVAAVPLEVPVYDLGADDHLEVSKSSGSRAGADKVALLPKGSSPKGTSSYTDRAGSLAYWASDNIVDGAGRLANRAGSFASWAYHGLSSFTRSGDEAGRGRPDTMAQVVSEDGWSVFAACDVILESGGIMECRDLEECKQICLQKGYGGLVLQDGWVRFLLSSRLELLDAKNRRPVPDDNTGVSVPTLLVAPRTNEGEIRQEWIAALEENLLLLRKKAEAFRRTRAYCLSRDDVAAAERANQALGQVKDEVARLADSLFHALGGRKVRGASNKAQTVDAGEQPHGELKVGDVKRVGDVDFELQFTRLELEDKEDRKAMRARRKLKDRSEAADWANEMQAAPQQKVQSKDSSEATEPVAANSAANAALIAERDLRIQELEQQLEQVQKAGRDEYQWTPIGIATITDMGLLDMMGSPSAGDGVTETAIEALSSTGVDVVTFVSGGFMDRKAAESFVAVDRKQVSTLAEELSRLRSENAALKGDTWLQAMVQEKKSSAKDENVVRRSELEDQPMVRRSELEDEPMVRRSKMEDEPMVRKSELAAMEEQLSQLRIQNLALKSEQASNWNTSEPGSMPSAQGALTVAQAEPSQEDQGMWGMLAGAASLPFAGYWSTSAPQAPQIDDQPVLANSHCSGSWQAGGNIVQSGDSWQAGAMLHVPDKEQRGSWQAGGNSEQYRDSWQSGAASHLMPNSTQGFLQASAGKGKGPSNVGEYHLAPSSGEQQWAPTDAERQWLVSNNTQDFFQVTDGKGQWLPSDGEQQLPPSSGEQHWAPIDAEQQWLVPNNMQDFLQVSAGKGQWLPSEGKGQWLPSDGELQLEPGSGEQQWAPSHAEQQCAPSIGEHTWAPDNSLEQSVSSIGEHHVGEVIDAVDPVEDEPESNLMSELKAKLAEKKMRAELSNPSLAKDDLNIDGLLSDTACQRGLDKEARDSVHSKPGQATANGPAQVMTTSSPPTSAPGQAPERAQSTDVAPAPAPAPAPAKVPPPDLEKASAPAPKPEPKAAPKPELKPAPTPEPKLAPTPEPKPASKQEPKPEPKLPPKHTAEKILAQQSSGKGPPLPMFGGDAGSGKGKKGVPLPPGGKGGKGKMDRMKSPIGRRFHWQGLSKDRLRGTIFDLDTVGEDIQQPVLNLSVLQTLFEDDGEEENGPNREASAPALSAEVKVFSTSRAQHIAIVFRRVFGPNLTAEELGEFATGLGSLNIPPAYKLDAEHLELIATALPSSDEATKLQALEGNEKLRRIERLSLPLTRVPFCYSRIRALRLKVQAPSMQELPMSRINRITEASQALRESTTLRQLLVTVARLGSWINSGGADTHQGFALSSALGKLQNFRALRGDRGLSLLHVVALSTAGGDPEEVGTLDSRLSRELEVLPEASRQDLVELGQSVIDFREQANWLLSEAERPDYTEEIQAQLRTIHEQEFADRATQLEKNMEIALDELKATLIFFAERWSATDKTGLESASQHLFVTVVEFCRSLHSAAQQILEQPERFKKIYAAVPGGGQASAGAGQEVAEEGQMPASAAEGSTAQAEPPAASAASSTSETSTGTSGNLLLGNLRRKPAASRERRTRGGGGRSAASLSRRNQAGPAGVPDQGGANPARGLPVDALGPMPSIAAPTSGSSEQHRATDQQDGGPRRPLVPQMQVSSSADPLAPSFAPHRRDRSSSKDPPKPMMGS